MSYAKSSLEALTEPTSAFAGFIAVQSTVVVPQFTLESGVELKNVPVAFKTWGKLNENGDNALVICHALTGSADVEDWWGPLLGPGRVFDPTRFFIFCANVIGSPYGTVSSVTINSDTGRPYGPEMPGSSVKDDVRLHKIVLDSLGVKSVASVIGGSMGGMTTLEYALNTPKGFVRSIIPLATSARHSAWCISWGEAQRQSIYSDPDYRDGYYFEAPAEGDVGQPTRGLAAARMAALLTYRSRDSFESRFGRKAGVGGAKKSSVPKGGVRVMGGPETTDPSVASEADIASGKAVAQDAEAISTTSLPSGSRTPREEAWQAHNDGHRGGHHSYGLSRRNTQTGSEDGSQGSPVPEDRPLTNLSLGVPGSREKLGTGGERAPKVFSAQSYLRYQGDKFTSRFDANCYIHITRKMDTHDISHPSSVTAHPPTPSNQLPLVPSTASEDELESALHHALSHLPPALVIGIETDGLFTTSEQKELAAHIPDAELVIIPSQDGHDGFLLEFEAINGWAMGWLRRKIPECYQGQPLLTAEEYGADQEGFGVKKESVFGEAEADVTRW